MDSFVSVSLSQHIHLWLSLILALPLCSAAISGIGCRVLTTRFCQGLTTCAVAGSCVMSWILFWRAQGLPSRIIGLAPWIRVEHLNSVFTVEVNTLVLTMLIVVTSVSFLVHLYSTQYMAGDQSNPRFFSYLSLFTFSMLMLVTASDLLQLFLGWEGVGLCSYLLIGFWFEKPSANAAAMKAFIMNRVGDFGFILGIFVVYILFKTLSISDIVARADSERATIVSLFGFHVHGISLACAFLFIGAMGKSAQFFLHTWLPDAMEGPTPVSALIHAATMVTAGVFMVARLSHLFSLAPGVLVVITVIGSVTAFFAASVALVQTDIKKVIAYSTCSQLGYMFIALGAGAYSTAIFHLFTHAFFKALLFLSAGSVIHAMHHEQDMRKMGGLFLKIPVTACAMLIGTLSITGVPYFSGYYSKDAIIEAAYSSQGMMHMIGFYTGVLVAAMTSFYSWRLFFLTFMGKPRWNAHNGHQKSTDRLHESPLAMLLPLVVLAVPSVLAGWYYKARFIGGAQDLYWGKGFFSTLGAHGVHVEHIPYLIEISPSLAMLIGAVLASLMYLVFPKIPSLIAMRCDALYQFLLNRWYIDECYEKIFVQPTLRIGRFLWKRVDQNVIDRFGPNGLSWSVLKFGAVSRWFQNGEIVHYATVMVFGMVGVLTCYII